MNKYNIPRNLLVNLFLVVVDMPITSSKNRFEQLEVFESIVGFYLMQEP